MATEMPTRRERRQALRDEAKAKRKQDSQKNATTRYLAFGLIGLLVVLGVILAAGPIAGMGGSAAAGKQYPDAGRDHVNPGQPHGAYTSNPPTSGPHYPDPVPWGIYDRVIPDENLIHNLEHGGIVIGYNCADGCSDLSDQLKGVAGEYRSKIVLAPRANTDVPNKITLQAWTWLDAFDQFDASRIRAFIKAHKDKAPELLPD